MADYVVDASVIIEYLVTGPYTLQASAFFTGVTSGDRLAVPEFCLIECTNVLWKHVRFQGMPITQANAALKHLHQLPLIRVAVKGLLDKALEVGLRHGLAIYDSVYLALTKHRRWTLLSIDQPQLRVASAEGISTKPITDFVP